MRKIEQFERVFLSTMRGEQDKLKDKPNGLHLPFPTDFPSILVDVYKQYDTFILDPVSEEEKNVGKLLFADEEPFRPTNDDQLFHSVSKYDEFLQGFKIFTNGLFDDWKDWSNMAILGSSVIASLLPLPKKYANDPFNYYHTIGYPSSDIDIYFYGISKDQYREKCIKLHEYLKKKTNGRVMMVKTTFTLTFIMEYPNRPVQVVFGNWKNLDHVLLEPDIDCSCVAFTGSTVFASPRARLSFNKRWIVTSQNRYLVRKFPEYESRLIKYSRRGFYIVDEKLDWSKVSTKLLEIGRERVIEHLCVRGRQDVTGLRLLIIGTKYNDVLDKVDIFEKPSFKMDGLAYGPNIKLEDVRKNLKEPVYELTNYGECATPNPYIEIESLESLEIKLHENLEDPPSHSQWWRRKLDWYRYLWINHESLSYHYGEDDDNDEVEEQEQ